MLDEPNIKFTGPHLFTKSDILGECPGLKMQDSKHWKKLQMLTGLEEVKKSLLYLSELAKTNYERELLELPPIDFTFNRLFLGPPGTGKSVVAKLYGQILAEMGVLSKGHVVVKNATALIGKYIGWSEANTTAALEEAKGGVLVIDEAYTLASDDIYRKAIVTTLVGGIQNVPGEDRCVILIGYEDKMRKLLEDANPGLARRFPMEDAFLFKGYSIPQLKSILQAKLDEYKISANDKAMKAALDVLEKARSKLNFGNGGEVENLITRAKSNCLARLMEIPLESRPKVWSLEPQDFDPEYNRVDSATTKLKALFADVVDCEPIIAKFEQYQIVSKAMKSRDLDPHLLVPTTFVFKGPPGTGKTTTARKIAQVYYDMGFLSAPEVVECSVTDLIGSYVGQTGPKTIKALERGLGKVLFIDEAYRFAQHDGSSDSFASDAISELVDSLTKPKFMGKIIVILAGYEDEMNSLLQMNPGLASRFSEEVIFKLISPAGCITVLQKKLRDQGIEFPIADTKNGHEFGKLENIMHTLSNTKGWGNARDVETLGKMISRKIFAKMTDGNNSMVCDAALALETTEDFSKERQARTDVGASLSHYI
ncbi:P-loop containing nucleoside triphosphate hydrolase protein [Calycina marina]|uniref:P-loop containing nucleoside triphosphate hydrolase protein n=1 Tax=Calycina marina TaxID=1763456 RepID=A0A9P8CHF7_9HELO|nr:P-loop containing nucleoside triphosphate hydrolase protein [Calycina marina]